MSIEVIYAYEGGRSIGTIVLHKKFEGDASFDWQHDYVTFFKDTVAVFYLATDAVISIEVVE